jgi:hypothetical protein
MLAELRQELDRLKEAILVLERLAEHESRWFGRPADRSQDSMESASNDE